MKVGELIKEILFIENINQSEMAEEINLQKPQLNDIIKGKRRITPKNAQKIGEFLEIPPLVLIIWQNIDDYKDSIL